jgi:hypothetical protein
MSSYRILAVQIRMGRIFALLVFAVSARLSLGQQDQKSWHVLVEPAFMRPAVSFPIAGSKTTVLVPGYMGDGDLEYFSKADWEGLGLTWQAFRARASQNATEKKVSCDLIRDRKKVVQYAAITSEDPLTATMILTPDFLKKFQDIFGSSILVAVPNRFTVYVFPGLASAYKDYSPLVLRAYHESTYPVSRENFEISPGGSRAIGAFEEE